MLLPDGEQGRCFHAGPTECGCAAAAAASAACLVAVEHQTAMITQVLELLLRMQETAHAVEQEKLLQGMVTRDWQHLVQSVRHEDPSPVHGCGTAIQDHQCAMHALEGFSADRASTISASDLVATTRALGFENAFVSAVGEDLNCDSVRYLFRGSEVNTEFIPFNAFNKAMRELADHHSIMSESDGVIVPSGSVDFGSIDALAIAKEAESDRVSLASTFDKTSEAHTHSCSIVSERRLSRFTTQSFEEVSDVVRQLGGYSATLNMRSQVLGSLECIVIEPIGKQLGRARFVTTGVVICLHGMPPSHEVVQEWAQVLKLTKWLDLGISVAIPNLQMSAALQQEDLEAVVEATLELMNFHRCIIAGKFWGAQRAVELAASERLIGKVDGLILVAPSSPAPSACSRLDVPVLLCWARDDDTACFEEAEVWIKALDDRCAPSMLLDVPSGGHRFDRILQCRDAQAASRRFTIATLMMATLEHANEESECKRSQRIMRLSRDLPEFLQFNYEDDEDYDLDGAADNPLGCIDIPEGPSRRLIIMLPQWIQAGVPTDSE